MFKYKVVPADPATLIGHEKNIHIYHFSIANSNSSNIRIQIGKRNYPILITLTDSDTQLNSILKSFKAFLAAPDRINSDSSAFLRFFYFLIGRKIVGTSSITTTMETAILNRTLLHTCRLVKLKGWLSPWLNLEICRSGGDNFHVSKHPVSSQECETMNVRQYCQY